MFRLVNRNVIRDSVTKNNFTESYTCDVCFSLNMRLYELILFFSGGDSIYSSEDYVYTTKVESYNSSGFSLLRPFKYRIISDNPDFDSSGSLLYESIIADRVELRTYQIEGTLVESIYFLLACHMDKGQESRKILKDINGPLAISMEIMPLVSHNLNKESNEIDFEILKEGLYGIRKHIVEVGDDFVIKESSYFYDSFFRL